MPKGLLESLRDLLFMFVPSFWKAHPSTLSSPIDIQTPGEKVQTGGFLKELLLRNDIKGVVSALVVFFPQVDPQTSRKFRYRNQCLKAIERLFVTFAARESPQVSRG